MSVKYWGDPVSQPCRTIEFVLKKLDVEYENNMVVLFKETRTEEYKKIHPKQNIPLIEHDGTKIWESNTQCRYLLDTFEGDEDLLPRSDLKARAKIDALLDWCGNSVRPSLTGGLKKILLNVKFFDHPEPTEEEKKECMDSMHQIFAEIEGYTGEHDFLANDKMSIADVQIYNEVMLAKACLSLTFEDYPNLEKWLERMAEDTIIKELDDVMLARLKELS
ncbi:unnamed protein product [Moneuplotes crassus]|uniref:Glutathione transferase n=1 Tax=Euplotes crassus TaxID=5936 RepID=A0AAD1XWL9_EUPCR|nr:unnamed protein product [Moneuplotes crassus]